MTNRFEIYKCEICGNIVEVLFQGEGELVCCGEPMILLEEKTQEEGNEKHVPVIGKELNGDVLVKVGEVPHPMEESHYIQLIEVFTDDGIMRKYLKPHEAPEYLIKNNHDIKSAREYCNIHGLWKG